MPQPMLAFHYDVKHAMWTADFMNSFAAALADWGYNTIIYEVEDKLHLPQHPALSHSDALTAEETIARCGALRHRGFSLVPLVQTLGHAEHVLTQPGYTHLRESPAHAMQYNPLSQEARTFIIELIDATIEAVQPETYFHLGGDETWNLGQSDTCKEMVAKVGTGGLYLHHMLPIIKHVIGRGLRPILWADMALSHPEIIDHFPREVIWMDWDYWTGSARMPFLHIWGKGRFDTQAYSAAKQAGKLAPAFVERLEQYAFDARTAQDGTFPGFPYTTALRDMGFDVITAPATRSHGDAMGVPLNTIHVPNCYAGCRKGCAAGLGACVTSWAIRHNHPLLSLPAAFAGAQGAKAATDSELVALMRAFTVQRFGVDLPEFATAVHQAEVRVPWCERCEMQPPARAMEALAKWLTQIDATPGGRDAVIRDIETSALSLKQAEALFTALLQQVRMNADDLSYWLEGVRHTAFCAAFSLAVLRNQMVEKAPVLRQHLEERRAETGRLFAVAFPVASVANELAIRYDFHEAVISAVG